MHLMIDLETLSLSRRAVVTQIGWALFDPQSPGIVDNGAVWCNPDEQIKQGRVYDWDNFKWWMKQDDAARNAMVTQVSTEPMPNILQYEFVNRFEWDKIEGVWANGILFDLVILEDLLANYGIPVPWHYRAPRDFKTMRALRSNVTGPKPEIAHSAMHDAIAQAIQVQNIFHSLLNETGA